MKNNQTLSIGKRGGKRLGAIRKKGVPNRSTMEVKTMVDCIFARVDPIKKFIRLLRRASDKTQAMTLLRLMEYRYGRPSQSSEDTPDTRDIKRILVVDVPRPARPALPSATANPPKPDGKS